MENRRHEQSNVIAMGRIGAFFAIPYIGYWWSILFADSVAHEIHWKLAVSILVALFGILSSVSNSIVAVRYDRRIDTVAMLALCSCLLALAFFNNSIKFEILDVPNKELFNAAAMCYFAMNGIILLLSLLSSILFKGNIAANDSKY